MKVAVIGSRKVLESDYEIIKKYIPQNTSEIVSGGAVGVDTFAKRYAQENNLLYKEFLPDYNDPKLKTPKAAPIIRNKHIVDYSDYVLAFWDGSSKGTANTIDYCIKSYKPVHIYLLNKERKKY